MSFKTTTNADLNIRDVFAVEAMSRVLEEFYANPGSNGITLNPTDATTIATNAYLMADAMLVARKTPPSFSGAGE